MKPSKSELFRPVQTNPKTGEKYESAVWWMTYSVRGERRRESTGKTDEAAALVVLAEKKLELAKQIDYGAFPGRVPISDLLDLVLKEYARQGRKTLEDAIYKVESELRPFFGRIRAGKLTTDDIEAFQDKRLDEEMQPASVNRELALLRRAYNLAARRTPPLVAAVPHFPMLPEDNARSGFLDWPYYRLLRDVLPDRLRLLFVLAFHVGARLGELKGLEWRQVDFARNALRLAPMETKNREPRTLPLYGEMREYLVAAWKMRAEGAARIFVEGNGDDLGEFRKSWKTARKAAGVPHLLFHDLRRTAVRNMMDAGLSEHEAMRISGHKTNSVFRRYDIIDNQRMARNATQLDAHFREQLASTPAFVQPESQPQPREAKVLPIRRKEIA